MSLLVPVSSAFFLSMLASRRWLTPCRIFLPKDNQVLTLVLAGIRAPLTARNPSEKSEPFGSEAAAFATQRYMQRDVEIEIETVDKSGGFIGTLYLNKTENAAITLVREGLASVHAYSAEGLSWAQQLFDAETEAKKAHRGVCILSDCSLDLKKLRCLL
jgi:staphylococcal nuclease domain-containing protein 1